VACGSLKDKEAVTDVTMKTIELDPPTDFQFHGRDIVVTNKVIVRVRADGLRPSHR